MCRFAFLVVLALAACSQAPEAQNLSPDEFMAQGGQVYTQYCAACHQPDGAGLPNLQPRLVGNAVVAGEPKRLMLVVLQSPAAVLPADRPHYQNTMPAFGSALSDAQIAEVLTYIRAKFGNASAVSAKDVAAARAATQ